MDLPKVKQTKPKKRVGRGFGSGKGAHTSSRGMKGQKSRNSNHILFEGLKTRKSMLVRLPLLRGKGKNIAKPKPVEINLDHLNNLKAGTKVDVEMLVKEGIVKAREVNTRGVKVLGSGNLEKKLTVLLPTTKSAAAAIETAGGKVE